PSFCFGRGRSFFVHSSGNHTNRTSLGQATELNVSLAGTGKTRIQHHRIDSFGTYSCIREEACNMAGLLALFIPILALSIPIVAIISGGPIGKALAERINTRNAGGSAAGGERVAMLERRIEQLERLARTQAEELD